MLPYEISVSDPERLLEILSGKIDDLRLCLEQIDCSKYKKFASRRSMIFRNENGSILYVALVDNGRVSFTQSLMVMSKTHRHEIEELFVLWFTQCFTEYRRWERMKIPMV